MSAIDHLRQTLQAISTAMENAAITDFVYWKIIMDSGIISRADLQQRVEDALQDPTIRAEARKMYSGVWEVLEKAGTETFFEDLLREHPPTGKPN